VLLNGQPLEAGDGVAIGEDEALMIHASQNAEILLFDLA
jgi:hypothetical protein